MAVDLMIAANNSTDAVVKFVDSITDGIIKLSKGTLVEWQKKSAKILTLQIQNIQEHLMKSYYLNADESQIKVNGNAYNILGVSNKEYTRLWASKNKSQKAIEEIGFLNKYEGIVVKDGTDLYNHCGKERAQCLSHILRYIKGITDFNEHSGAKEMAKLLSNININIKRNKAIADGKENFEEREKKNLIKNIKTSSKNGNKNGGIVQKKKI